MALTVESSARPATADARRPWLARPPEWLWGAAIGVQVAFAALLTSYTFFFFDDFMFMQQGRTQAFGLAYLRAPLFEHFSPVTRVIFKAIVDIAPGSFAFAHAVQLVIYGCAIAAMAFVLRAVLGRTWLALILTTLFGQSVFLLRLLNWLTATINLLPATVFMLLALGCYLRWRDGRDRRWLAASLISYAGALCDYETAMLFPIFLALLRFLVISQRLSPRIWVRELWEERWVWAGFCLLDVATLINYYSSYYTKQPSPSLGKLTHFLEISLVQTFVPGVVGIARIVTPGTAQVVGGWVIFIVLVTLALYVRPRAWRALFAALLSFLVADLALGLNRIATYGVYSGAELYYQQSAQMMFVVLAGFGLSVRWGGRRDPSHSWRITRRAAPVGMATLFGGLVLYGVLYVTSVHALANGDPRPHAARAYIQRFLGDVRDVVHVTGRQPVLVDLAVPTTIMQSNFAPFNQYSQFFPVLDAHLRYSAGVAPFAVAPTGALEKVRVQPIVNVALRAATLSGQTGVTRPIKRADAVCLPPGSPKQLRVPLPHVEHFDPLSGPLPAVVTVDYTLPVRVDVAVLDSQAGGLPAPIDSGTHIWGPGPGTGSAIVTAPSNANELELNLPGRACITRLAVERLVSAS